MIRFELNNIEIESPKDWDDISFTLIRDEVYHGIDAKIETPLTFVGQSYDIIYEQIKKKNFDAVFVLKIFWKDKEIYRGQLDLYSYRQTNKEITCNIEQMALFEKFQSRQNYDVELWNTQGIDGQTLSAVDKIGYDFTFIPIPIRLVSRYRTTANHSVIGEMSGATGGSIFIGKMPFLDIIFDDLKQPGNGGDELRAGIGSMYDSGFPTSFSGFHLDTELQIPNLPGVYDVEYDLSGILGWRQSSSSIGLTSPRIEIVIAHGQGSSFTETIIHTFQPATPHQTPEESEPYNFSGTVSLTLNAGDKIRVFFRLSAIVGSTNLNFWTIEVFSENNDWDISITTNSQFSDSQTHKVSAIYEAFNRVLESITGVNDVLRSTFYGRTNSQPRTYQGNGCGSFRVIANGFNLRGFNELVDEDSEKYKPPIVDAQTMFNSLNAIDNIGLGVEPDHIRVEKKEFFYQNIEIENLGKIENVEFFLLPEYFYNEINIGYSDYDDSINDGLDEFATTRQYRTSATMNRAVLELFSDLIASPFAHELTRRKTFDLTSNSGTEFDDNIFITQTNRRLGLDGKPMLLSPSTVNDGLFGAKPTSVLNVLNGDWMYNVEISPVRNLLRHMNYINDDARYVSGKGNVRMKSTVDDYGCKGTFEGNELSEKEPVINRETTFRSGVVARFDFPGSIERLFEYKKNKYGYFEFETNNRVFRGHVRELKYESSTGLFNFELLLR